MPTSTQGRVSSVLRDLVPVTLVAGAAALGVALLVGESTNHIANLPSPVRDRVEAAAPPDRPPAAAQDITVRLRPGALRVPSLVPLTPGEAAVQDTGPRGLVDLVLGTGDVVSAGAGQVGFAFPVARVDLRLDRDRAAVSIAPAPIELVVALEVPVAAPPVAEPADEVEPAPAPVESDVLLPSTRRVARSKPSAGGTAESLFASATTKKGPGRAGGGLGEVRKEFRSTAPAKTRVATSKAEPAGGAQPDARHRPDSRRETRASGSKDGPGDKAGGKTRQRDGQQANRGRGKPAHAG